MYKLAEYKLLAFFNIFKIFFFKLTRQVFVCVKGGGVGEGEA